MSFWQELWGLAKETPDERRAREREGRVIVRAVKPPRGAHPTSPYARHPPTSHPDDYGDGFDGLDASMDKMKAKRRT